jgi:gliding motility-associated-like protein
MNAKLALLPVLLILLASSICAQDIQDHIGSGYALSFDGVDDYVDLGNIYDDLKLPLTISAWIYLDPGGFGTIFASQDNTHIYNGFHFFIVHTDMVIEYGDGRGNNSANFRRGKAAPVENIFGKWVHVTAIMRDANDMDLYLNGINIGGTYIGNSQFPMSSSHPGEAAKIGFESTSVVTYHFKGIMDELRVWKRALSVQEIRDQMCRKLKGDEEGLIGYWDFDNTKANVLMDRSPFFFDGAIRGIPQRVFSGAPVGDESVFLYTDDWNGATLTLVDDTRSITVSDVNGSAAGVQLYKVNEFPAQDGGLNTMIVSSPYYGVFVAAIDGNSACDVEYKKSDLPACRLYTRILSSAPFWEKNLPTLTQIPNRIEFIGEQGGMDLNVNLGSNDTLCSFSEQILSPLSDTVGFVFLWQDGSKNSKLRISDFGTYWVNLDNGCTSAADTLTLEQVQTDDLFVPNVFTPNGDQLNQYFTIDDRLKGTTFSVFDRWGKRVYQSNDYQNNWDGDDLPSGVYFYLLNGGECIVEKKGALTILR